MIGVDADQDWINPGFVIASMMKRVDKGVYYATKLVVNDKFKSAVTDNNGVITLGIGTKVAGEVMEGISLSSLTELDEFIKMGQDAEASTGKQVLPMSPDSIKSAVKSMRDAQPSWVWDAVNELQTKISNGTVTVPLVMTQDAVDQWRGILG
jgi:basic membrane protein A